MANSLKRQAVQPGFIRQLCLQYGQLHHQVESRISLRLLGHEAKRVKEMKEEDAVQLGATVVSEAFLFVSATALLLWEMGRKGRDDARSKAEREEKERLREQRWHERVQTLESYVEQEKQRQELLQQQLDDIRAQLSKRWI